MILSLEMPAYIVGTIHLNIFATYLVCLMGLPLHVATPNKVEYQTTASLSRLQDPQAGFMHAYIRSFRAINKLLSFAR